MRSNKAEVINVSEKTIKKLIKYGHVHTFSVESDLFYEGQIPFVAYLILDGRVQFSKRRRNKGFTGKGSLIGLRELYFHSPSSITAKVFPETKICYLDRSTILEIIECNNDPEFSTFFKEYLLEKAL